MADLLQKVFCIFARPYYMDGEHKVFHSGPISIQKGVNDHGDPVYVTLRTNNDGSQAIAPDKINAEGEYTSDPWFLHSTYTSYNRFREALKKLIAEYGTSNVRCTVYLPIDYEVLPNE